MFQMIRSHVFVLGIFLSAFVTGLAYQAQAQSDLALAQAEEAEPTREYLIKAALLYKFAKFTKWPNNTFASADAPLSVCVLGEDPFGAALSTIEGKKIRKRQINVRRLAVLPEAEQCHLIFVSQSESEELDGIMDRLKGQPVLTIADMPEFAKSGGVINLKVIDDRSHFEVNVDAATQAGLLLSSKMLRLADNVVAN